MAKMESRRCVVWVVVQEIEEHFTTHPNPIILQEDAFLKVG
jgi:hypothetical protein